MGKEHCLFLTQAGMVFSLGNGEYGQLGINKKEIIEPEVISSLLNYRIMNIFSGNYHNILLGIDRTSTVFNNVSDIKSSNKSNSNSNLNTFISGCYDVLTFGDNSKNQLGLEVKEDYVSVPIKNKQLSLEYIADIDLGDNNSAIINKDSNLIIFGEINKGFSKPRIVNEYVCINDNEEININKFKRVKCLNNNIYSFEDTSNIKSIDNKNIILCLETYNNYNKTVGFIIQINNVIKEDNSNINEFNFDNIFILKNSIYVFSIIKDNNNKERFDINKTRYTASVVFCLSYLNYLNRNINTKRSSSKLLIDTFTLNNDYNEEITKEYDIPIDDNKFDLNNVLTEESNNNLNSNDNNNNKLEIIKNSINNNVYNDFEELNSYLTAFGVTTKQSRINTNKKPYLNFSDNLTFNNTINNISNFINNIRLNKKVIINNNKEKEIDSKLICDDKSNTNKTELNNEAKLSFRPKNLPKKSKEEEIYHRRLVEENKRKYEEHLESKKKEEIKRTKLIKKKKDRQNELERIWIEDILPNWYKYSINKNFSIIKYFYEGIPSSVRGKVWLMCLGNKFSITSEYYEIEVKKAIDLLIYSNEKENERKQSIFKNDEDYSNSDNNNNSCSNNVDDNSLEEYLTKQHTNNYSKFNILKINKENSIRQIDLDVSRTFVYLGLYKQGSPMAEDLREVLRAFVASRPDIGYIQGLSFIAGLLLIYMNKFQSFVALLNLVLHSSIISFFRFDEQQIKNRFQIFKQVFYYNLPELCEYFENINLFPEMYLTEWCMTLFSKNLNIDLAARVWDIYIIKGIKAIYQAGIVILSHFERKFIDNSYEFEDILKEIKSIQFINFDEDELVELMQNVQFPKWIDDEIIKLDNEYIPINN